MSFSRKSIFSFICAIFFVNCTAAYSDDKSPKYEATWQFISKSEIPPESLGESDAFLTRYIMYRDRGALTPKYILMEGWENGWDYSFWTNGRWETTTETNEFYYEDFEIGYFNADGFLDIVLYNALQEENWTNDELPPMPRLFLGDGETFKPSALSCSMALHGVFESRLRIYKRKFYKKPIPDFLKPYIATEEKNIAEKCD